uniref:Uncharacterized protein n=1 Tax=Lactuca sativa TaxID=4236 RepID=A0A9R1VX61_LACSA|nr:hypothetical protein LSAT_V11C400206310 [Lactuca sativa]
MLYIGERNGVERKRILLNVILCGALCGIWTARNKWIFNKIPTNSASIVDRIKVTTISRCKNRGSFGKIDWRVWNINPFFCL